MTVEEGDRLASTDPDYSIRDLYNAISNGNFPSWTFYIQVMTFEQAENWQWNPFDLTKVSASQNAPQDTTLVVLNLFDFKAPLVQNIIWRLSYLGCYVPLARKNTQNDKSILRWIEH